MFLTFVLVLFEVINKARKTEELFDKGYSGIWVDNFFAALLKMRPDVIDNLDPIIVSELLYLRLRYVLK